MCSPACLNRKGEWERERAPRLWFLCVYTKDIKIGLDSSNICGFHVEYKQLFSVLLWQQNKSPEVESLAGPRECEQIVKMVSEMGRNNVQFYLWSYPRSRVKLLPLPVTGLAVPSTHQEPLDICHLSRPCPLPPLPTNAGARHQCLAEKCSSNFPKPWRRTSSATKSKCFGIRHTECESGFYQAD